MKIWYYNFFIELENKKNIDLEIKFNLTEKGREWIHIGDALYKNEDISVNAEQFKYLMNLIDVNKIKCNCDCNCE